MDYAPLLSFTDCRLARFDETNMLRHINRLHEKLYLFRFLHAWSPIPRSCALSDLPGLAGCLA
jgi:hypothetical protein